MTTLVGENGPELLVPGHRLGTTLECRVTDPGKKPTAWHPVSYFRSRVDAERAAIARQTWSDRFGHHLSYRVAS